MSERGWDRIGAAAGPAGVLLALAGLLATGATSNVTGRPARDAAIQEVVLYMSRPASATSSIGFACVLTGVFLILVFATRLCTILRSAADGPDWLATAGLAGIVFYLSADVTRFMFSDARNLAVGHHLQPAEAVAFFDISNALTPVAWAGIAMFLIPSSLSAVRSRALPAWLAWVGLVVGVANLVWAWLPPGGTSTPAEDAFLLWLIATGVVLFRRGQLRPTRAARSGTD